MNISNFLVSAKVLLEEVGVLKSFPASLNLVHQIFSGRLSVLIRKTFSAILVTFVIRLISAGPQGKAVMGVASIHPRMSVCLCVCLSDVLILKNPDY